MHKINFIVIIYSINIQQNDDKTMNFSLQRIIIILQKFHLDK